MLNALIRFSLAQRVLVLGLAVVLLALGLWKTRQLPVEVLPDLTKPTVTILTESPGLSPEEVEMLVSIPLENALMGVTGITRLRTINDVGLSVIHVEFDWGTDIYQARQFVQERLTGSTDSLPEGVLPYLTPVASLMGNILLVGLVDPSGETDVREIRTFADWIVARKFKAIPGIAEVISMGGGIRQIHVQPSPERMLAYGIRLEEVREATRQAVGNTSGGFLAEGPQEIMVRNLAMSTDLEALAGTLVREVDQQIITLGDVADLRWDIEPMRGDAGLGTNKSERKASNYRGVIISITKSPGFDTLALTDRVEAAMEELRKSLPEGVELVSLYRQADFIDLAIGNLEEALRDGAIMVALVLFLFLFNVRITLITLTAIPLSLGITVLVFDLSGMSVNSMTLGGLAVAIGMVVDDAIVDVENVYRRLRERAGKESGPSRLEVIATASAEVRSSILYATVLIILVFLPLLALSGVEGRLFAPIAVATIVSMAASFLVSLTVIPALSSYLLKPGQKQAAQESVLVRWLKTAFEHSWLKFSLDQPLVVIGISLLLLWLAITSFLQMGRDFLPAFREPTVLAATTTNPGTSLKQTTELSIAAQEKLLQIPGVHTVGYRVGRAEHGDHIVPVSTVEFDVEFDTSETLTRETILEEIRATMRNIPGTFTSVGGPLADRVGHMLSGVPAKIAIKVYGPDLDEIRRLGGQITEIARGIPGLEEARGEQQAPIPQLRIEVRRDRAAAYGLRPGEINERLASLLGGEALAAIYEGERSYELVLRLPAAWRESPTRLATLPIDTPSGRLIQLGDIADLRQASGPNVILRENTLRRYVVSINPTSTNLVQLVEELQRQVDEQVALPAGYTISWEGEYRAQQEARKIIWLMSCLILGVIAVLLYGYFKNLTFVALVLSNIPISLIGGILLTQEQLGIVSIATLVGFIAVAGIAARNNIMMLSHYLHLMRRENQPFGRSMVVQGTLNRLVPVLMTALSAGIALLPLVLAANEPGKEILNPVAVVIVGGLASSTLLGLGLTPALFLLFGRRAAEQSISRKAAASQ